MSDAPSITFAYPQREHEVLSYAIEHAVTRVLRSGSYVLGSEVQAFEQAFARFTNTPHAVAVSSGTDALVCALIALGVGPGHEVVVPAFGFVAAAEAIVRVGARPVFVDIEPITLGPDPAACASVYSQRTTAVVVMHLFGQAVDLAPLRRAVPHLRIIEDAAQGIGTRMDSHQVGTRGTLGTFSFFPAKSLGAAGDAGAVTTCDPELAQRVRHARVHGATGAYRWDGPGGNYRMDALQASILTVKLAALEQRLARRRTLGSRLAETLTSHGVVVLRGGPMCDPTFAPFALRTTCRDERLEQLRSRGIDARVHYPSTVSSSKAFRGASGDGAFPEAERATRELLSLPCSPELRDDEFDRLLQAVDEVFRG